MINLKKNPKVKAEVVNLNERGCKFVGMFESNFLYESDIGAILLDPISNETVTLYDEKILK